MRTSTVAAPPPAPAAEPTLEQYRLAYRQVSRPGWPSFEQCMADHVRRTCLAGIARNMGRARWAPMPVAPGLPQGLPVPPTPTQPPARQQARPGPQLGAWARRGVDLKRAAANDHDD